MNPGRIRILRIAAILLGLSISVASHGAGNTDAAQVLPDWNLKAPDGSTVNFYEDSADKPAVLLFWATWCPYCRQLMPHIEKVRRDYAEKGVKFYALNIWEDADPVAYLRDNGYGFELLLAADEVAKSYGIKGTPGLIIIDAARRVHYIRKSGTTPTQVENDLRFVLGNIAK